MMFNRIKRYKARFAGAISIFGIAAFSILFYWKSNFGSSIAERLYSVLRAGEYHSKIVLEPEKPDFTNPVQAVGKTELLPEPNSTYNLEITGAAWETAAELSLIEEAEIQNREKVTNLEPEIGFSDSNPDEVQKIKTSKPNRRDKLTQLYIQEVERYLSRNSQKKNGTPLPKVYSEVVIDSLEQVHWKEDSKFDSLEDAQIQSKTIPTIRQDVAVSEPDFEEETAHPQKVIESVSDLRVKEKVKNRFSETVTSRKKVLNLELNSDEEIKNRFRKTAYISKMWELPRKPDNHKTYSKADDRQRDENSSLDFYFLESPSVNTAIKEEKSNFSIEDPIANSEHTFVSKIYQETPLVASWELQTDTFEIRILENANIERWVWIQIQEKLKEIKNKTLQNKAPSLFASGKEILLYFPRRDESRRKNQPNPKKQEIVSTLSGYIRKDSNSLILERFLEVPNVNRKQMRYYAIRTNGPPPTVHKQV